MIRGNMSLPNLSTSKSEAPFSSESKWDKSKLKINDDVKTLRIKLKRAADFYKKEKLELGVAKSKLIEVEFLLKMIGDPQCDINIELLNHDIREYLEHCLDIFTRFDYIHLRARVLKQMGTMWLLQYEHKIKTIDDQHQEQPLSRKLFASKSSYEQALALFKEVQDAT